MKRYLGVTLLVGAFLAITIYLVSAQSSRADQAEKELAWTRLQRDYAERAGWMRSNPDPKSYADEARVFFATWFKQVDDYNARYGGDREFDDYLVELEKRGGKGTKARKAAYEYTKKTFDQMRSGNWSPVFTATDKGMRLDVLDSDIQMLGSKRQIRWNLALWGAQRNLADDGKGVRKMVTSASFKVAIKLLRKNPKDAPYEMNIDGDPGQKLDYPERFVAAFPAQMVLGHYDLDLVPSDVTKAEITFTVTSRANSGGEAVGTYAWNLDVPEDWKLKPGEAWEGATETELANDEPL